MTYRISIAICTFHLVALTGFGQDKLDSRAMQDVNNQINVLLENKKLFKYVINKNQENEPAIYIQTHFYSKSNHREPFINKKHKTYFWPKKELFFMNVIDPSYMKVLSFSRNWYFTSWELITTSKNGKALYIQAKFKTAQPNDDPLKKPEIMGIKISKVKTL